MATAGSHTSPQSALEPKCTAASGWVLIGAIFYAPWAFGSRTYWLSGLLSAQLLLAAALWAAGFLKPGGKPSVPWPSVALALFLVAFAGVALLNPRSPYGPTSPKFDPLDEYVHWLPATVNAVNGWLPAAGISACLLALLAAADLARRAHWRRRLFAALAGAGVSVAAGGVALKLGVMPWLTGYLAERPWAQGQVFGPFDYHGNAGAFLNLTIPAVAVCAGESRSVGGRIFWWLSLGLCYAGLLANASRAALVIGALLSPLVLWIVLRAGGGQGASVVGNRRRAFFVMGAVVGGAAALCVLATPMARRYTVSVERLRDLSTDIMNPANPRYLQSQAAWKMVKERRYFGAGAGSYKLLVQEEFHAGTFFAPAFRPGQPFTVLSHAHEDYLQTLVEWGWIGWAGWAMLVSGAFAALAASWARRRAISGRRWRWARRCWACTLMRWLIARCKSPRCNSTWLYTSGLPGEDGDGWGRRNPRHGRRKRFCSFAVIQVRDVALTDDHCSNSRWLSLI